MPRGFPLQDTGPGMSELFHDLAVEQEEQKSLIRHGLRGDPEVRHVVYYGKPSWPSYSERCFPRAGVLRYDKEKRTIVLNASI